MSDYVNRINSNRFYQPCWLKCIQRSLKTLTAIQFTINLVANLIFSKSRYDHDLLRQRLFLVPQTFISSAACLTIKRWMVWPCRVFILIRKTWCSQRKTWCPCCYRNLDPRNNYHCRTNQLHPTCLFPLLCPTHFYFPSFQNHFWWRHCVSCKRACHHSKLYCAFLLLFWIFLNHT